MVFGAVKTTNKHPPPTITPKFSQPFLWLDSLQKGSLRSPHDNKNKWGVKDLISIRFDVGVYTKFHNTIVLEFAGTKYKYITFLYLSDDSFLVMLDLSNDTYIKESVKAENYS